MAFELWRGDERLARIRAEIGCSNGIQRCFMNFEALGAPTGPGAPGSDAPGSDAAEPNAPSLCDMIPYVEVRESNDWVSAWGLGRSTPPDMPVFAPFTENVALLQKYAQTASATLRLYTDAIAGEPFLAPPSAYRFLACRTEAFDPEPCGSQDLYLRETGTD